MKKSVAIIAGVVVIGGSLWLGGAWYTGTRLEALSTEQVVQFNEELKKADLYEEVTVRQVSFERGLFNSQARYALTFSGEKAITLEFDTRYEHGPFPFAALSRGQFAPKMAFVRSDLAATAQGADLFRFVQGSASPLWAEALVSYVGDVDYSGGISAMKPTDADDEVNIDFQGAMLQGRYEHASRRTTSVLKAPGLSISNTDLSDQPFEFSLADVQMDVDLVQGRFDAYLGNVELRAARMTVTQPTLAHSFAVDQLVYGAASSQEDERFFKGDVYLRGQSLTVNDFNLGDLSLAFKGDQLDGASLQGMREATRALTTDLDDRTVDRTGFFSALTQEFQRFLDGNPKLALAPLSWKNGQGESTLDVRTELTKPTNFDAPTELLAAQMFKTVDIDLRLHKPMVVELSTTLLRLTQNMDASTANAIVQQQYNALATQLLQAGLAQEDGEHLACTVRYAGDKVTVNGREVSMRELMGLMMLF